LGLNPITLYQGPSKVRKSKLEIVGTGANGAWSNVSIPPGKIATCIHEWSSIVHFRKSSKWSFPYRAIHPVMQLLSPKHFAVHMSPFRQSASCAKQALAWREHWFTKQDWSTSDASNPLVLYLEDSSSSAHAGGMLMLLVHVRALLLCEDKPTVSVKDVEANEMKKKRSDVARPRYSVVTVFQNT
jgi:hypothetical protein